MLTCFVDLIVEQLRINPHFAVVRCSQTIYRQTILPKSHPFVRNDDFALGTKSSEGKKPSCRGGAQAAFSMLWEVFLIGSATKPRKQSRPKAGDLVNLG